MHILQLDHNHPLIVEQLSSNGFSVEEDFISTYDEVLAKIKDYDGIIIRSRIPLDKNFLEKATHLKFIARVGAGLENIAIETAQQLNILLINSPEGNRDAVAEQVLGMLLVLTNRLFISSLEVKKGIWKREENRGIELKGKTFGIIGYGNMGKAVAKRLSGFGLKTLVYDILPELGDEFAEQVSLQEIQDQSDFISLHIPLTKDTFHMIDDKFIQSMKKNFYLINTSRGNNINTASLVEHIKKGKILGAALDVLEYEKKSFESIETQNENLQFLLNSEKCIITPHIAGWTHESKEKLAQVIVDKILAAKF